MRYLPGLCWLFLVACAWAQKGDPMNDPKRPVAKTPSLSPAETAKALQVPPGFSVQVIAGEPQIRQPVAYTIDDRGRLWVLENTNYPKCPGEPRDRIVVLEDVDGDGAFEKQTVFFDKLTFASGIAVGFGGVYVGAPPNLLFFPDANGDLKPDSEPRVLLDGWGNEDTHETLNNFTWGPDGWLYGTQGVFTLSKVGAPGTPDAQRIAINAGVWRFHPQTQRFERYAEGASNQWGIDWNDHGQAFFAACVIPHIWQCIQGARYQRQAGQPSNPHTYEDIKTIGGFEYEKRAYCGAMVYLGGLFPPEYRDAFFFNDIHINKMRVEKMTRAGSGYRAEKHSDFVVSSDAWYRGLSPQYGPDGGIFINDWYDKVPCYQQRDQVDRTNGRLYKISYTGLKPVTVDLTKASSAELVQMQLHPNEWYVRHARRLLQERGPDPAVHAALAKILRENPDDARQLRALWALHVTGGLSEALLNEVLTNPSEYVRGWAIQLACESGQPSQRLTTMAQQEKSALVRLYLASAAGRLEIAECWPLLTALAAHAEDNADQNIPLLLWYAAEPAVAVDFTKATEFLSACKIDKVQEFTARRLVALDAIMPILSQQDPSGQLNILRGLNAGLKSARTVPMPAAWPAVYEMLRRSPGAEVRELAQALAVKFGATAALGELRSAFADEKLAVERRRAALDALVGAKDAETWPLILKEVSNGGALRGAALLALGGYESGKVPATLLSVYARLSTGEKRDALATLAMRPAWAAALLASIDAEAIPRRDISVPLARQLQDLHDPKVDAWLAQNWGAVRTTSAEKQQEIARFKAFLTPASLQAADSTHGRALFAQTCALCHTLFGAGAKIGPELPGAFGDIDYLLQNILDPNAVIGKDYQQTVVQLKDGQTLIGIVGSEDAQTLSLKSLAGPQTFQRSEIAQRTVLDISLMPEGLLAAMSEQEVRDLFAYLGRHGQVPMLLSEANVNDFFDGTSLARWVASSGAWKVERGEIRGAVEKGGEELLMSDMTLASGRFRCEAVIKGEVELVVVDPESPNGAPVVLAKLPPRESPVALDLWRHGGQSELRVGDGLNLAAHQPGTQTSRGVAIGFRLRGAGSELSLRGLKITLNETARR